MTTSVLQPMSGLAIGHATNAAARTGCTVIRFDVPALTAVEVRGAAPGTRELDVLAPGRASQRADAILLSGGSAFGLRAADGVMSALAEIGRGYPTSAGPVPIVPAAVIFDLAAGQPVAPSVDDGRSAFESGVSLEKVEMGAVGAGAGATWDKLNDGPARPGGIGIAQCDVDGHVVTAIVVLNAVGVVRDLAPDPRPRLVRDDDRSRSTMQSGQATTLMAVVTDYGCDHGMLTRVCVAAHDALARTVVPAHTHLDGDVAFASTLVEGNIPRDRRLALTVACELAVEAAILRAAQPDPPQGDTLGD